MSFPDLIFVSMENWDEVWRRNQFLCSGLARRFPDSKILFVGLARDFSNAVRRRDFSDLGHKALQAVPDYPNIWITRAPKLAPDTLAGGRRWNERMFRAHVRKMARRLDLQRPLLWLNPHDAVHLAGRLNERALIYDITDDWALADFSAPQKALIEAQDRRLCRLADLVVVCSQALYDSRKSLTEHLLLLPNGVDVAHYQAAETAPQSTLSSSVPIFGYTGTLHDERVDAQLIVALARAFPAGRVCLIGPNLLSRQTQQLLNAQPNIELRGPVPYSQIAQAMRPFDVCIVPHRESAFTQSLNPIKLWEYLACGKPIVSTPVAGFVDYPHLVHLASGAPEFVAACHSALHEGENESQENESHTTQRAARQAEAARNSWEARLDQLLEVLEPLKVL